MKETEVCDNCLTLLKIISNQTTMIDQYRQLLEKNNITISNTPLNDFNNTDMSNLEVKIYCDTFMPEYMDPGASGADVHAQGDYTIHPGESALIHTGIYMEIPEGYECQVRPRSGLAYKHNVTVLNSPGTIDSSYRGECNIIIINHGRTSFEIINGMRVAQFVFQKVNKVKFNKVSNKDDLSTSVRGISGCGSTGV